MDAKFLDFWGDIIRQMPAGQYQSVDFSAWMNQGLKGPEEVVQLFRKYYGLQDIAKDSDEYPEFVEKALLEFNRSLGFLFDYLEVVPKKEYLSLEKKYKTLKKKVEDLEAAITHLKLLLKANGAEIEEGIGPLNQMLKSQNEQFLKMMDSMAEFYGVKMPKKNEED